MAREVKDEERDRKKELDFRDGTPVEARERLKETLDEARDGEFVPLEDVDDPDGDDE